MRQDPFNFFYLYLPSIITLQIKQSIYTPLQACSLSSFLSRVPNILDLIICSSGWLQKHTNVYSLNSPEKNASKRLQNVAGEISYIKLRTYQVLARGPVKSSCQNLL